MSRPRGGHEEPAAPAARRPLTLVEPMAHVLGGHAASALSTLSRASHQLGVPLTVVAVKGVHPHVRAVTVAEGAVVVGRPDRRDVVSRALARAARAMERLFEGAGRMGWSTFQSQCLLASRCLREVASLRVSDRASTQGTQPVFVVLTASEGLPGATCALSGVSHVRVVHEADHAEGFLLGRLESVCRRARRHSVAVCTTSDIQARLASRYPGMRSVVQPFTLYDADLRVGDVDRQRGRGWLDLGAEEVAGALVGGWWPVKDIATVERALSLVRHPVGLVIAGGPTDPAVVERMRRDARGRVVALGRQVSPDELRMVYGACDFTLVSRVRESGRKESGLVMDAVRYGVPLVVSDHDPELTEALAGADWARVFPAGDPAGLAAVLDEIALHPLARPRPETAGSLGMLDGEAAVELFEALGCDLARHERRSAPRLTTTTD